MKWKAPHYHLGYYIGYHFELLERRQKWHRAYAWLPTYIRAQEYEGIVVPAHYVWFDYVDRRMHWPWLGSPVLAFPPFYNLFSFFAFLFPGLKWAYRPHTGTVPIVIPLEELL